MKDIYDFINEIVLLKRMDKDIDDKIADIVDLVMADIKNIYYASALLLILVKDENSLRNLH